MKKRKKPAFVLTYRAKRRLRKLLIAGASVLLALVLVLGCWFTWLDRYVVYTEDGARLEFTDDYRIEGGEKAVPPDRPQVEIHYNEGDNIVSTSTELTKIAGFYVTTSMLLDSVDNVTAAIEKLPGGTPVMLDLKSIYGNFYYSTEIPGAPTTDSIDIEAVDRLIKKLVSSDTYLIARVPALQDRDYGLNHTDFGLSSSRGKGYLWNDDDNCYWLDPTSSGTVTYLITIATELREMGFDEVVFDQFRFPDTTDLLFDGSREEAITQAAATLVSSCSTEGFAVSFVSDSPDFVRPEGRSRLYLRDVSAATAQSVADACTYPVKDAQLVFLTETNDTRFDIVSVMRPLPGGEAGPLEP